MYVSDVLCSKFDGRLPRRGAGRGALGRTADCALVLLVPLLVRQPSGGSWREESVLSDLGIALVALPIVRQNRSGYVVNFQLFF